MEPSSFNQQIKNQLSKDVLKLVELDYAAGASNQADISTYGKLSGRMLQHIDEIEGKAKNLKATDRVELIKTLKTLNTHIYKFLEIEDSSKPSQSNKFIVRIKKELSKDDVEILSNTLYEVASKSSKISALLEQPPPRPPKPIGKERNTNRSLPEVPNKDVTKKTSSENLT